MARIQQSVDIRVMAQVAYDQLARFEDYPRFMEEVESAEQVDDTHVRWTTKIGQHAHDWNSEIIEQKPGQVIEWRNVEGPVSTGRIEVQPLGAASSRVTFIVESEATGAGVAADAMTRQVEQNLQRLKQMIESSGETGATRAEVHAGNPPKQSAEGYGDVGTSEAMQNALQPGGQQKEGEAGLGQAIKRAVPPSN